MAGARFAREARGGDARSGVVYGLKKIATRDAKWSTNGSGLHVAAPVEQIMLEELGSERVAPLLPLTGGADRACGVNKWVSSCGGTVCAQHVR